MLFAWITDPNAWLALRYADAAGDRSWDRQYYFPFSGGWQSSPQHNVLMRAVWGWREPWLCVWRCWHQSPGLRGLTNPLFTIFSQEISARDLILLLGGLFLIWKASKEIHESIEGEEEGLKTRVSSFLGAIVQIMLLGYYLQPRLGDYRCGSVRSPVYYDGRRGDCRRRD
ncbi:integral membrane transport protein [Escherichia coli]|nr:integral membrane transport protein [Escherichia coli]